jgi:hypothetical protein
MVAEAGDLVKAAGAEAEGKYLSGVGVARQRAAITEGLRESVNALQSDITGTFNKDVKSLLMVLFGGGGGRGGWGGRGQTPAPSRGGGSPAEGQDFP